MLYFPLDIQNKYIGQIKPSF